MEDGNRRDEAMRMLAAQVAAHEFILEHILSQQFLELPKQTRLVVAETLLDASEQTQQLRGAAQDEHQAGRLADMVVQAQKKIDQMIGRALQAADLAEAAPPEPEQEAA